MILVQLSDFAGFHILARSIQNDGILQAYITRFEERFIKLILGATLGQLYIDDKSQPTQDPIYAAIEDAFMLDDTNSSGWVWESNSWNSIRESKGLKDVLISLIYSEFVFDTQTKHSQSGVTINQSEVANNNSPENAARFAEQKWNEALTSISAIQWYCTSFAPTDYVDYNGKEFTPKYSSFL